MSEWKKKMIHGGDYNPDQWLDNPEILAEDIRLMKEANINSASVGIFAWTALEPEEGNYQFEWLGEIIDKLYENDIEVILATPSGARPAWMAKKYPEVLRVSADMTRNQMGERHNHCMTSPVYRQKVWEMNRRLAERFGKHPGVVLWHLSNEYRGECFCPLCQQAFREWIQKKYGSLKELNKVWWTAFWSHTYTNWDQIEAPVPKGEMNSHALALDWKRFTTHQTVDFCSREREAVIAGGGGDLPFTSNLMGFFEGVNYFKFSEVLDIVSWDNYPEWHKPDEKPGRRAAESACTHDLMRGIKRKNFLMMESTPSVVNWNGVSKLKRPGMHALSSFQAIAHGSDSVQYFQWRKSRGSSEKFHGAVIDHYGKEDTRVFAEVAELGARLKAIGAVAETSPDPEVAIIYDWENRWAIDQCRGPRNEGMHYLDTVFDHYEAFWKQGISVDIQDMECDFSQYKIVVAPMLYMYRAGIQEKLRQFVNTGGILIGTYWSGVADETDLCFLGGYPGGMMDLYGLRAEEIDALWDGETNQMVWNGKSYRLYDLCERIITKGAEPIAVYETDFYKDEPALLKHNFGSGTAYYIAARPEQVFLTDFYRGICSGAGVLPAAGIQLSEGTTVSIRANDKGEKVLFLQNYNDTPAEIVFEKTYRDMEQEAEYRGTVVLQPYEVKIIK